MDMSTVIRKATLDQEQAEYRKEGRCFECGKQGHLAQDCLSKQNRPRQGQGQGCARSTHSNEVKAKDLIDFDDASTEYSEPPSESLAARVMKLTKQERNTFIDEMKALGEDMGFANA